MSEQWRYWSVPVALVLVLTTSACSSLPAEPSRRLAVLVAAPLAGQQAMLNDVAAMDAALRQRGFRPEEIVTLHGPVRREALLTFFLQVGARIASWSEGEVFLYYSGHGMFTGTTVESARPGLLLSADAELSTESCDTCVFWDEVFTALALPKNVQLILVPDC